MPLLSTWTGGGYVECPRLSTQGGGGGQNWYCNSRTFESWCGKWGDTLYRQGPWTWSSWDIGTWWSITCWCPWDIGTWWSIRGWCPWDIGTWRSIRKWGSRNIGTWWRRSRWRGRWRGRWRVDWYPKRRVERSVHAKDNKM